MIGSLIADDCTTGDESALFAQIANGDEAAFDRFYDLMAGLVFGIARRVVRDEELAREVTQEVFVELWRTAPVFDSEKGSIRSWTATLAHRRSVDRVRSEQSRRNRELADSHRVTIAFDDVSEQMDDRCERRDLQVSLGALTEPQLQAITLAYYGGNTYRDVASLLDVPEGTVKTRIRDGLNTLRRQMGGDR